jgi:hypothetical protein
VTEVILKTATGERVAPVQGYPPGIPWAMHLEAYAVYSRLWAPQPAMITGGCRGGFGTCELDDWIPGWRDRLPPGWEADHHAKGKTR